MMLTPILQGEGGDYPIIPLSKMRNGSLKKICHLPEVTQPGVLGQGFFEKMNF